MESSGEFFYTLMAITKEQKSQYYPDPSEAINSTRTIANPLFGEPKPARVSTLIGLQAIGIFCMNSGVTPLKELGIGIFASAFTIPARHYME